MMLKQKSNPWAKAKYLFALPLAVFCVSCLSSPEASEISDQVSEGKVSDIFSDSQGKGASKYVTLVADAANDTYSVHLMDLDGTIHPEIISAEALKAIYSEDNQLSLKFDKNMPMKHVSDFRDKCREVGITRLSYSAIGDNNTIYETENIVSTKPVNDDEVFTVVEEQPVFPGGEKELMNYIKKTLRYPKDCADEGVQGRVTLSFVVDKDGSVVEPEVMRSPDERLSAEAIRIVESMPKWEPGRQRGLVVRVKYVLPVTFKLQ